MEAGSISFHQSSIVEEFSPFEESLPILAVILGFLLLDVFLFWISRSPLSLGLGFILVLLLGFTLYFFRNPKRTIPLNPLYVLSPADGKVIEVEREKRVPFSDSPVHKIAIFLSLWDVHVNRMPVGGNVISKKYQPGTFQKAFLPEASSENESMWVGIASDFGTVWVKQIAGILARRVVCKVQPGDAVVQGACFGMIKLGSRVEVFLPCSVELKVRVGDRVRAGETILGEFVHGKSLPCSS